MTKKSVETFTAYLDIMQGDPIYANASRALGLHEAGIPVAAIVDPRPQARIDDASVERLHAAGVAIHRESVIRGARGR